MSALYRIAQFGERRQLALAVLSSAEPLSRRAGSFLGQLAVDDSPLSQKQIDWLVTLAERAGLEVEANHG